jgi:adenylate kinase
MTLSRLLFIGVPGAGKGTQAKLLNLAHISTGDVIRKAFAENDSLIVPYQEHIEKGGFLPDELIFNLIEQHIKNLPSSTGYVLDGAVRTIPQAEFAVGKGLFDAVFEFYCTEREAKSRIEIRREKEKRKDDLPEAVRIRFKEYNEKTFPAITFLEKESYNGCSNSFKYFVIDAMQSIENIHEEIIDRIDYASMI